MAVRDRPVGFVGVDPLSSIPLLVVDPATQRRGCGSGQEKVGVAELVPVCIAKTHLSISSDARLLGAPTDWTLPVREVRAAVGGLRVPDPR